MHEHVQHFHAMLGKTVYTSNLCTSDVFADECARLLASRVWKYEPQKVLV